MLIFQTRVNTILFVAAVLILCTAAQVSSRTVDKAPGSYFRKERNGLLALRVRGGIEVSGSEDSSDGKNDLSLNNEEEETNKATGAPKPSHMPTEQQKDPNVVQMPAPMAPKSAAQHSAQPQPTPQANTPSPSLAQQGTIEMPEVTTEEIKPLIQKTGKFAPLHLIKEIFPIEISEIRKFVGMSLMMFAIIFVFTMTRDTKDTLIVTNCGAEAIAFLKVYGVVPAAAAFMVWYSTLSHHLSKRAVFYVTIIPFFAFFAFFAFLMYPMRNVFHASAGKEEGLSFVVNLARYWMFSLYYIVAEIWGSAGVPLLFWQCANEVTSITQAKRFYPLFALVGNFAPIASGQTMKHVAQKKTPGIDAEQAFEHSLKVLTSIMLCAGLVVMYLYDYVHKLHELEQLKTLNPEPDLENSTRSKDFPKVPPPVRAQETKVYKQVAQPAKKKKPKMGMAESFKFLLSSKYLGCLCAMVISYGLSMEFTEIIWKAMVKRAYPDKSEYMNFMGNYSSYVGVSTLVMLLIGGKIIKFLGWQVGALTTPVVMGILAFPFFGYLVVGDLGSKKALLFAVMIGTVQNIFSKATKYALFDPTKEMAYIPLDKESKSKGKAAIDVLGARLGKSGGALAQQVLVIFVGSILNAAPILGILFYGVIALWIGSVLQLARMFEKKTADDALEK
mmetsp:Transcript_34012/g.44910  ORF Transcript_34012/g.44910 Transcript_34012/m.44910 type:complete len:670 (-) Transcript_34012:243-2252(-)